MEPQNNSAASYVLYVSHRRGHRTKQRACWLNWVLDWTRADRNAASIFHSRGRSESAQLFRSMGSYTFRWEHPADEVYVTGTFDNWSKSVKLDKKDFIHEKTVDLPSIGEKIFYKFVADGDWKYDHTGKTEADHEGNLNNVLYPSDLGPYTAQHNSSSVGPGAS
nr:5'-amp-activated protein kinase subunit beta-2 [Quercus suber]